MAIPVDMQPSVLFQSSFWVKNAQSTYSIPDFNNLSKDVPEKLIFEVVNSGSISLSITGNPSGYWGDKIDVKSSSGAVLGRANADSKTLTVEVNESQSPITVEAWRRDLSTVNCLYEITDISESLFFVYNGSLANITEESFNVNIVPLTIGVGADRVPVEMQISPFNQSVFWEEIENYSLPDFNSLQKDKPASIVFDITGSGSISLSITGNPSSYYGDRLDVKSSSGAVLGRANADSKTLTVEVNESQSPITVEAWRRDLSTVNCLYEFKFQSELQPIILSQSAFWERSESTDFAITNFNGLTPNVSESVDFTFVEHGDITLVGSGNLSTANGDKLLLKDKSGAELARIDGDNKTLTVAIDESQSPITVEAMRGNESTVNCYYEVKIAPFINVILDGFVTHDPVRGAVSTGTTYVPSHSCLAGDTRYLSTDGEIKEEITGEITPLVDSELVHVNGKLNLYDSHDNFLPYNRLNFKGSFIVLNDGESIDLVDIINYDRDSGGRNKDYVVVMDIDVMELQMPYRIYSSIPDIDTLSYVEATVTLNGASNPVEGSKVLAFRQNGEYLGYTITDKQGKYRFDMLDNSFKYMFVAQYPRDQNNPPEYHPDAVGYITPTSYEEKEYKF